MRPRWILDLHEDFPGSAVVAAKLEDAVIVDATDAIFGDWPALDATVRPLVGYGTMRTMTRLRRDPRLGEAVFDDYGALRCSMYYRYVFDLLGRAAFLAPFSALPQLPLARMFSADRVFVRSDTNYKLFPAGAHDIAWLSRLLETYREHRDELVVVSEVVNFTCEYRSFCRDGRFVCGSSYPYEPWEPVPGEVRGFAEMAAQRLVAQGMTMTTIDVGLDERGAMRLVEVGGVNSWGIYGSDVDAFIAAMEAEAVEQAAP